MSTQEDIDNMLHKVEGRLAGHKEPAHEGLVFRAPEPDLSTVDGLRRFVRAEVRAELDAIAQAFREHPALRPFPMAGEEG